MDLIKKLFISIAVALTGLLTSGTLIPAAAAENEIKIGWQPAGFFELFLAKEEGRFKEAGLKPTFVKFLSGPAMFAALKNGDIDVTFGGMPPFVYALAQGLDVSVFYWSYVTNPSLIVRKNSGIKQVSDLRGKRVATVMGSSAHYNLIELLADSNISISEVDIINMQLSSLLPAFSTGDIQAAMIWEPWGVKLTRLGGVRINKYGRFDKYSQTGIYWGRRKWMEAHPQLMQMFLGVLDKELDVVRDDPRRAAKALAHQTGLDASEALEVLQLGLHLTVKNFREPLAGHPLSLTPAAGKQYSGHVEALFGMSEFLFKNGNIPVLVTRDRLTVAQSPQFLQDYLKRTSDPKSTR